MIVTNNGDRPIYIGKSSDRLQSEGLKLYPGQTLELDPRSDHITKYILDHDQNYRVLCDIERGK